jgi:hypothetical protein
MTRKRAPVPSSAARAPLRALQQDTAGRVEHAAAQPGHAEQHERADHRRIEPERAEGEGRDDDPGDERRRQAPARHEGRDRHRADEAADTEGRVQVAGARLVHAEDADGEHDVEHVEAADQDPCGLPHGRTLQRS